MMKAKKSHFDTHYPVDQLVRFARSFSRAVSAR